MRLKTILPKSQHNFQSPSKILISRGVDHLVSSDNDFGKQVQCEWYKNILASLLQRETTKKDGEPLKPFQSLQSALEAPSNAKKKHAEARSDILRDQPR